MKKSDFIFLRHVIDAIDDIMGSVEGLSKGDFESNKDLRDATLRRIEVIGEAVKNISQETKSKYSKIEWKKIAGARDIIIHSYFSVDWDLVWDIIKKDIRELRREVSRILENE
jgi:uncharacterized protein with HEPN domain